MNDNRHKLTRRAFIGSMAVGAAGLPAALAATNRRTATDSVLLGRSGIRVSRLGVGTGSNGGHVQRQIGQEGFNRLVRHALDRGITFFDTADNYDEMHQRLAIALKGVDRSRIQIQTKMSGGKYADPLKEIDRFRKEVDTDYFDSLLIHCVMTSDWQQENARLMDLLEGAKEKGIIRSHGVSIHGLQPLAAATSGPATKWIDVALLRVNHDGTHMDGPTSRWAEPGNRDAALPHIRKIHGNGSGVIGMKLVGNGNFEDPAQRERAIRFVMNLDYVDAVIMGFKSPAEIDEAISRMNNALGA